MDALRGAVGEELLDDTTARLKAPSTMNGVGPSAAASIQPSRTGTWASSSAQSDPVTVLSAQPLLRCTDINWIV